MVSFLRWSSGCRHKEIQALSRLHFNYRDKPRPGGYASSLAGSLQTCAPENVLLATYNVSTEYDAAAIHAVLDVMTPSAVRVMWSSKTFQVYAISPRFTNIESGC